jgi:hypothetical protein
VLDRVCAAGESQQHDCRRKQKGVHPLSL